ncbi:MAG TPA: outer membrane beta-barrel protein [Verrucomicrobiae bacterium]|nr:outer membrane beta-barrel protein [Verrucomicrobiae bacterium]
MKKDYCFTALFFCFCFTIPAARAQMTNCPPGDAGFYFRFGMGPSHFENGQVTQFGAPVSSNVKYETGVETETVAGYAFNKYLATDMEFGFIGAQVENVNGFSSENSQIYNFPALANFTLSYPIPHTFITPYAGAGFGGSIAGFNSDSFSDGTTGVSGGESDMVFAWQAFAGLRFKISPLVSLGVGYKYFTTGSPTFNYPADQNFDVSFDGVKTHSVLLTFQIKFW